MNCRTAEEMVSRYTNRTLSANELEEFLEHICNCSSCYDELETYFIVREVIQQLDESAGSQVLDFRMLLEQDIRRSRRYVRRRKTARFLNTALIIILIVVLVLALLYIMTGMIM